MIVNKKKSITLPNRTNYFIPDKDKVKVTFSSPESYQSRQMKIEGYENRLYWQYKYCEVHGGQTFFYTLTYNDKALPRYKVGKKYDSEKKVRVDDYINCFDYEDLRDLLTGGFRKQLLRKYGSTLKYFIGAELGDGKGQRGMHNNPHYHILLFVEPAPLSMRPKLVRYEQVPVGFYVRNSKNHRKGDVRYKRVKITEQVPYVKISEQEMSHLVKLYWQGFDEDVTGYRDYNTAKYGIVHEGKFGAQVKDFRAVGYCAKYVTKDVKLIKNEKKVEKSVRFSLRNEYRYKEEVYAGYFRDEIIPRFNTPMNPKKTKWCFTDVELIKELQKDANDWHIKVFGTPFTTMEGEQYMSYVTSICEDHGLWASFEAYVDRYIEPMVQDKINEWRNRYSNKCRISHGVGDYAIDQINDKLNPSISVPCKKGFKNRPISMYYYRKMYCDVVKDPEGNNLYVLNQLGSDYKAARLPKQINKMVSKCKDYIPMLLDNQVLFENMRDSDVNTDVFMTYSEFSRRMRNLLKDDNLFNILQRYAEYKLVYENRFFSYNDNRKDGSDIMPPICLIDDYKRFLVPSFYSVPRDDLRLAVFLEDIPENYLPYSQHPYFLRYIGVFSVLDLCADYFFIQADNEKQKKAEEIAATKRFHSVNELKQFYSVFK